MDERESDYTDSNRMAVVTHFRKELLRMIQEDKTTHDIKFNAPNRKKLVDYNLIVYDKKRHSYIVNPEYEGMIKLRLVSNFFRKGFMK